MVEVHSFPDPRVLEEFLWPDLSQIGVCYCWVSIYLLPWHCYECSAHVNNNKDHESPIQLWRDPHTQQLYDDPSIKWTQ